MNQFFVSKKSTFFPRHKSNKRYQKKKKRKKEAVDNFRYFKMKCNSQSRWKVTASVQERKSHWHLSVLKVSRFPRSCSLLAVATIRGCRRKAKLFWERKSNVVDCWNEASRKDNAMRGNYLTVSIVRSSPSCIIVVKMFQRGGEQHGQNPFVATPLWISDPLPQFRSINYDVTMKFNYAQSAKYDKDIQDQP